VIHCQSQSLVGSLRGFLGCARALITQKIYQGLERWPHLAAARVIKKKSCRRRCKLTPPIRSQENVTPNAAAISGRWE
jgi:hypothetical protein